MALAIIVLLCWGAWFSIGEPHEIERSRAINLGVMQAQVEEVMGEIPTTATTNTSSGETILYFGQPSNLLDLKWKAPHGSEAEHLHASTTTS
jgi:hypothetical protein